MGRHVRVGDLDIWTEQVGAGPDVLLIGGLGDTVESWQFQLDGLADRYRMIAFDNRGAGRTKMPDEPATVEAMADDAAAVLAALGVPSAHVAGFSGGSIIGQELALRHPERVRSLVLQSTWGEMDVALRRWAGFVSWLTDAAPSERDFLTDFFLFIYTARAHNDGTVDAIIDEAMAFPYKQSPEDTRRTLDAFLAHGGTAARLPSVTAPTLVLAGGRDPTARPELGSAVADAIPRALFEVMVCESHQPFQEIPDMWNARVDAFWQDVEARPAAPPRPRAAPSGESRAAAAKRPVS
jgi:pimeloyl-ACP methyl ester carboxylesterase